MACRALLKRRKLLTDHFSPASRPLLVYRSHSDDARDSRSVSESSLIDSKCSEDISRAIARKPELYKLMSIDFIKDRYIREPPLRSSASYSSVHRQLLWEVSVRNASNTATKRQEQGGDEDEAEAVAKKKKEASPEECDQAVEGLSNAKAKAQAKKAQDSQSAISSALKKTWSVILGIGPALRVIASMSREDWWKKLVHLKQEFISTMKHYWLGSKLLWADVRICSRLLMKLAGGKSLSRRERQQLTRTTADIFRLVPMAVFIIVPFMEFLLPVFLKLFPNMLPSTFQDKMKEEEALKRKLQARIEYAKFLQETAKEMAKEIQTSRSGEAKRTAEDLDEFLNRVRKGTVVSNEEILGFAKLFNDELTLDNISRPRLVNMCKYMGIQPFGTDRYLRFMLRQKLLRIKKDDMMIQAEGVESLSEDELREDCRERGMLEPLSVDEMRQHLRDWLDLSLNHSVPSSLLILSRAFTVSGKLKPEEAVRATLSSLPDEVVDTVSVDLPSEDSVSERQRKLEYLEMEEELIKEEEESVKKEDTALEDMIASTSSDNEARPLENDDEICELSRALAVLASASSVSMEREEFLTLVNKEIELYNSKLGDSELAAIESYKDESSASDEIDGVSSALIDKVDAMLHKLEKEIDDVDAKIGDQWKVLDRDHDGKVTAEEVFAAAKYLKKQIGKDGVQELITNLSKDQDGRIHVEDIVRLGSRVDESSKTDV